jgi:hypothetical protein
MVEINPTSDGAFGVRRIGPVDLSTKHYLKQLAQRVIARGWRPSVGAILPDGIVLDSLESHVDRNYELSDATAADRVIGSFTFFLSRHGDLRIEWQEKDHDEVVKLIQAKMEAGVRFFIIEPGSYTLVPIKRRSIGIGREVYVQDADIKKLIEGGFARFPTTRFSGIGQFGTHSSNSAEEAARAHTIATPAPRICNSAEEAARAHTIATPAPKRGTEGDFLIGATAIAVFLRRELKMRRFSARTVYNWSGQGKLPIQRLPNSTTLCASKSVLRQWFDDIGRGIHPKP